MSILVNGHPTKEFAFERGLHQGDPLSPFIFFISRRGSECIDEIMVETNIFTDYNIGVHNPNKFLIFSLPMIGSFWG